ncbi:nucleoside 5-triphosphatase RdgB [Candidatus Symbiothrix dinenymphae]|nr:nucleoside 5-triphosphatase RdgB [Candidatus Symbiothrix dinenymphae]
MKKIVFATNNAHKLDEVRQILGNSIEVVSLSDIHCEEDIPETADTLEGNALLKARFVKEHYGYDCFADDTGLEIKALNNEPGVYSARYAGEAKNSAANRQKVLQNLHGETDRSARFRTVIALILDGREHLFEGTVEGKIITEERGDGGFGYDCIFVPEGCSKTFAELGAEAKNKISHRARAVAKFVAASCLHDTSSQHE